MKKRAVILLVEDNRMDIEITLDAFREVKLENEIRTVKTGEEALDYLLGRGNFTDRESHPLPDLMLLDLKLPGISGLDVLKTLKQTPVLKRLPVIILTSSQEESDRVAGYDHGVNSYLVKPISFSGFLDVAKNICDYWLSLNVNAPLIKL
ncbi:MAG: response regulator [Thermovirgaceae bacterium]|nr:response regulator [Thermovirgaceae bacterium]